MATNIAKFSFQSLNEIFITNSKIPNKEIVDDSILQLENGIQ